MVLLYILLGALATTCYCNVDIVTQCNGRNTRFNELHGDEGSLKLTRYGPNADCRWNITINSDDKIPLFKVTKMDIKRGGSRGCPDRLRFYDVKGRATYYACGSSNSPPENYQFTSGSKTMFIRITSDRSTQGKGFEGSWTAVKYGDILCGGLRTMAASRGTISSNPGTYTYVNNMRCQWAIKPNNGKEIRLRINKFNVASGDKVTVTKITERGDGRPLTETVRRVNQEFTAPNGAGLLVTFRTNYIGTLEGFEAVYTT